MNEVWNLDPLYKGFDDPAFTADMEKLTEKAKEVAALAEDDEVIGFPIIME